MSYARRLLVVVGTMAFMVAAFSGTALAAHDSNNKFDLAPGPAGPAGADGSGFSNYNSNADTWDSRVDVSGLEPGLYTFYAEGPDPDDETVTSKTGIGVLEVMDGGQSQFVTSSNHAEPALATVNIRAGNGVPNGDIVLTATASEDDNMTVEDGELERYPVGSNNAAAASSLPDTGGTSLPVLGGALLLGSGILGLALLRVRRAQ